MPAEEPQANPPPEQAPAPVPDQTVPDAATETAGVVTFDDLLSVVPIETTEVPTKEGQSSPEVKVGGEELSPEERLELRNEQASEKAYENARLHYEMLSDPQAAANRAVKLWRRPREERTPEENRFMDEAFILPVGVREEAPVFLGSDDQQMGFDFAGFMGTISVRGIDKPTDYIPVLNAEIDRIISEGGRNAEQRDTDTARRRSIEGFIKAAFDHDDLEVTLQGMEYLGALKAPENLKKLKERMEALRASGKPEDQQKLQAAARMLQQIRERRAASSEEGPATQGGEGKISDEENVREAATVETSVEEGELTPERIDEIVDRASDGINYPYQWNETLIDEVFELAKQSPELKRRLESTVRGALAEAVRLAPMVGNNPRDMIEKLSLLVSDGVIDNAIATGLEDMITYDNRTVDEFEQSVVKIQSMLGLSDADTQRLLRRGIDLLVLNLQNVQRQEDRELADPKTDPATKSRLSQRKVERETFIKQQEQRTAQIIERIGQ